MRDDADMTPHDEFPSSRFDAPYDPNIERRRGTDPIKEYIAHKVNAAEKRIVEDIKKHFDQRFNDAFPNGDPHGHRMYHERSIHDADKWSKIKGAVTEKLLTGGVWLLVAFIAMAIWEALKKEVAK